MATTFHMVVPEWAAGWQVYSVGTDPGFEVEMTTTERVIVRLPGDDAQRAQWAQSFKREPSAWPGDSVEFQISAVCENRYSSDADFVLTVTGQRGPYGAKMTVNVGSATKRPEFNRILRRMLNAAKIAIESAARVPPARGPR